MDLVQPRPITRRTLAHGAAWSVPALMVAAAAPAFAASAPPGLQGWVKISKSCTGTGSRRTFSYVVDGDGDGTRYPTGIGYGLYVLNTASTTGVCCASITYYLPSTLTGVTWTRQGAFQGWSTPIADASAPAMAGMTGYTTTYSDTYGWTFTPASATVSAFTIANGVPTFTATTSVTTYCGSTMTVAAYRSVKVNNVTIAFSRTTQL